MTRLVLACILSFTREENANWYGLKRDAKAMAEENPGSEEGPVVDVQAETVKEGN